MKISKTLIAIFCMIFVLILLPDSIKAEDSLKVGCKTSSTDVYPGETIDVVVYLDNYDTQNIRDITTMQLFINLNTNYYTYVENSLKDLSDAKGNKQVYFLDYVSDKNQIQLQFSDLTKILSRNTKELYEFKVKINNDLSIGSNFDIGPDVFKCVDGRSTQINIIPSVIMKSNIYVVEKGLVNSNGVENNSDNITGDTNRNAVSNSDNTENGNSTINQDTAVNKSSEAQASNDTDTELSTKNSDINVNQAQAAKSINAGSIVIVIIIIVFMGLIIYYVFKIRRKKSEK